MKFGQSEQNGAGTGTHGFERRPARHWRKEQSALPRAVSTHGRAPPAATGAHALQHRAQPEARAVAPAVVGEGVAGVQDGAHRQAAAHVRASEAHVTQVKGRHGEG